MKNNQFKLMLILFLGAFSTVYGIQQQSKELFKELKSTRMSLLKLKINLERLQSVVGIKIRFL